MIYVISKKGCGKCEAAKDKLKVLDLEYEEHDESELQGSDSTLTAEQKSEAMAEYIQSGTLPVIIIKDRAYSYPKAMKELKNAN